MLNITPIIKYCGSNIVKETSFGSCFNCSLSTPKNIVPKVFVKASIDKPPIMLNPANVRISRLNRLRLSDLIPSQSPFKPAN
jgi:hypothetical protein